MASDELPRLSLYVTLLDQAIAGATEAATAHLIIAMLSNDLLLNRVGPKTRRAVHWSNSSRLSA